MVLDVIYIFTYKVILIHVCEVTTEQANNLKMKIKDILCIIFQEPHNITGFKLSFINFCRSKPALYQNCVCVFDSV